MANNYNDPTKTGPQGLKGLNYLGYDPNTSGVIPLDKDQYAIENFLKKRFSDYDNASTYYKAEEVADDMGWGDSVYDDNAFLGTLSQDVIQNRRADLQSAGVQLLNGTLKGVSTAATTIIDGLGGLPLGIYEAIRDDDISKLWDNEITQATKAWSDGIEKVLPNYRSVEEEEAPFWENLGTANFWGDTIIKNAGFIVGAYYGGLPYAKAGQLLTTAGVKTAQFFNASKKAIQTTAKIGEYATKGIHAGVSAVIEGSIEAKNNSTDWYNLQKAKTDDYYAQALEQLDNTYEEGTPEHKYMQQQIAQSYNNSLAELDQKRKEMGNMDLALNIPILTMSNIIQFAKILGGGFTTGVKGGLNIKGTVGNFVAGTGKHSYLKAGLRNALVEGSEEMSQKIASDYSGNLRGAEYTNYAIDEFRRAKVDIQASKESEESVTALGNALKDNFSDPKSWEEFFVGALFGLVGMPQFGIKDNGKFGFKRMGGGIWNDYKEAQANREEEQRVVDYLNTRGSKQLQDTWRGLVRNKLYEDQKEKAILNKDEKAYHDANQKQAISDVIMFSKAGKLEVLEAQLDDINKSTKDSKFLQDLIENNKQTKTVDQQKQEIDLQIQQLQEEELQEQIAINTILQKRDQLKNKIDQLQTKIDNETNPENKSTLERQQEDYNSQLSSLEENLKEMQENSINNQSVRDYKVSELENSKSDLQEYTFGPFMEGDTPMTEEEARNKVRSKVKETKALINTYKKTSEELQEVFQGKLTRDQEETLIFLNLQQSGNKRRIVDLINSLDNIKDDFIDTIRQNLSKAEQELNEARQQNKSKEELEKLEEKYNNYKNTLDNLNSIFYEELDPENLNTLYLESSGFTNILNAFLSGYSVNKDSEILGGSASEVLGRLQQKGKDIDSLIKETNLYYKKYNEYLHNPQNMTQDRQIIQQERDTQEQQNRVNSLEQALNRGSRAERAQAVEDFIRDKEPQEAQSEVDKLTKQGARAYQEAKEDVELSKEIIERASKEILGESTNQEAQEELEKLIKSIVYAEEKLSKDEIMESVKQQGQALIDALVQDPNFPKNDNSEEDLTQQVAASMVNFFEKLDLDKERELIRGSLAMERKADEERAKWEQTLADRASQPDPEESETPNQSPKDGSESEAKLPENEGFPNPPVDQGTDTEEDDINTSTAYIDKDSQEKSKTVNFNNQQKQSFAGKNIKGLKPWFSLYYQSKGPIVNYLEALRQGFLESVRGTDRSLQAFFEVSQEYLDEHKGLISTQEMLQTARTDHSRAKELLEQSAFYSHIKFLQTIYKKLGIQNNVKQLKANDKLIIENYNQGNFGIIPIIYKVSKDSNGEVIKIPVGIAMTELQANAKSKFKKDELLKQSYKEANAIIEFLKNNPEGHLETTVKEVMGGIMPLTKEEIQVSELYEKHDSNSTPVLGVVTNPTSPDSSGLEGNTMAQQNTISISDAKKGQVYVLVKSPFGNYLPALAVPKTLKQILDDKNSNEYIELVKRIASIFTAQNLIPDILKDRFKDYIFLPGLKKIEYDSDNKKLSFIYSSKLNFSAKENSSRKVELDISNSDKMEEKISQFLYQLLKGTEYENTLTINVNRNRIDPNNLEHVEYIKFISKFLSVNLNSTVTVNDWFSFNAPKGIISGNQNNAASNPINSSTDSQVPTDVTGTTVEPNTGTVTDDQGNIVNDDSKAKEQQENAQQSTNSSPSITSSLENKPKFSNQISEISQDTTESSSQDSDEESIFDDTYNNYHTGIYRKVNSNSRLGKYFETQRNKQLDISPQSTQQIPKNLNNIETDNFKSCQ